ncbi:MAG: EamA family transporter [Chloroflexi bacterium]|nr:EamA family transporter [Chloroflexota bacterium]MCI0577034.1 EamA family transporter [Chloroflexota bacterium]MCI0648810.1 EamA family transporter [Chloroflexota bacterium]MCI0726312.1 EamA family transporter [Chloroflexota bacterium]
METVAPPRKIDPKAFLAAAATVVLWASAFAGIRAGLQSYSPASVALLRYLIASLALGLYALVARMPLPRVRDLPGIILVGFLGFTVYNVALNAGEVAVSAGVASFLVASAPIYMVILAILLFKERLNSLGWLGIALSFSGVGLISLATDTGFNLNSYALLVLLAALVQAGYSVGQKPYLKRYGALPFTAYAVWAGTILLLIFLPGLIREIKTATPGSTLAVVYMGLFPGAIGYASWSFVLSRLPASVAGSFLYLVPAVAVLIAWLWLGEIPPVSSVMGGVLVVIGVVVVNKRGR